MRWEKGTQDDEAESWYDHIGLLGTELRLPSDVISAKAEIQYFPRFQ
jgi:hypothetical protein